jgi:hypothetical protein
MENLEQVIIEGANEMIKKYSFVQGIKFPQRKSISINNLNDYTIEDFENDFSDIGKNIIYFIITDELPFEYVDIQNKFIELKSKSKKNYHVSKINDEILWKRDLNIYYLYIGSKEYDAKLRFKQHLGLEIKSRQTYSMYLKDWWPENKKLYVNYFEFGEKISADSLQIIEDLLWEKYKPLFGKKGATFNKKIKMI